VQDPYPFYSIVIKSTFFVFHFIKQYSGKAYIINRLTTAVVCVYSKNELAFLDKSDILNFNPRNIIVTAYN